MRWVDRVGCVAGTRVSESMVVDVVLWVVL